MSVIQNNLLLAGDDAYNLQRSLRFRSSASAYLNRTPASAGNRKTWTWSGWVKRGALGSGFILNAYSANNDAGYFAFGFSSDQLLVGSWTANWRITTAVYRDPSAWYHIVLAVDNTQATASNRIKLYVNGLEVTSFSTSVNPPLNQDFPINNTVVHTIGATNSGTRSDYFDGYIAEQNFIDGQALTPSSFGENNAQTGVWQPKRYTGTYGTNGFYLPFSDNSSLSNLTADRSGNGNNWTANNISLTSGATYDSMTDVPTLTSATQANYCVFNPLIRSYASQSWALTNGNLQATDSGSGGGFGLGTISATSGKWYWEATVTAATKTLGVGWTTLSNIGFGYNGCYQSSGGVNNTSGSSATTFASYTTNDVIGIAVDVDAGRVWFSKNGTFLGSGNPSGGTNPAFTFTANGESSPTFTFDNISATSGFAANFGQRPFAYTPPTGFVALNTFNLPTPTIGATASTQANKYFDATTYTGNGSSNTIVNAGSFAPALVWIKRRSAAESHGLWDTVRGGSLRLESNTTGAESSTTDRFSGITSTGFTVTSADPQTNASGSTYVGWQWAGGSNVTNTAGSITSTVSANTSSGFSIVTYTGNGTNATVGHGLGVVPSMVIVKNRSNAYSWVVKHRSLGSNLNLLLNGTDAAYTPSTGGYIADLSSSTTVSLTYGSNGTNVCASSNNYVAYCFAEVAGFSRFGSYTGNGSSDGPFVYCGFRPKFVMMKDVNSAVQGWTIENSANQSYNLINNYVFAQSSNAESSGYAKIDFLSNGFKLRDSDGQANANGNTIIYMAFAENPLKYSLAR